MVEFRDEYHNSGWHPPCGGASSVVIYRRRQYPQSQARLLLTPFLYVVTLSRFDRLPDRHRTMRCMSMIRLP